MPKTLALFACVDEYEGPWLIARGSENAARVTGLNGDSEAGLEVELKGEEIRHKFSLQPGLNMLHDTQGWGRYRAWRSGGGDGVTVEVYFSPVVALAEKE